MKAVDRNINYRRGIIKDAIIIMVIFASLYFIDIRMAAFVAVLCTAILLTRRIIFELNPGFITGHKILFKGKENNRKNFLLSDTEFTEDVIKLIVIGNFTGYFAEVIQTSPDIQSK